jgi:hypothetical protein
MALQRTLAGVAHWLGPPLHSGMSRVVALARPYLQVAHSTRGDVAAGEVGGEGGSSGYASSQESDEGDEEGEDVDEISSSSSSTTSRSTLSNAMPTATAAGGLVMCMGMHIPLQ